MQAFEIYLKLPRVSYYVLSCMRCSLHARELDVSLGLIEQQLGALVNEWDCDA